MHSELCLYVGTEEESADDILCLELRVGPHQISIGESDAINGMTGDDFITQLGELLNTMRLFSREIQLPMRWSLDELLAEAIEQEFEEKFLREIKQLIKEAS